VESTVVEVGSEQDPENRSETEGARLDRFLSAQLGVSRARVRHLLEVGRVSRAGRALSLSDKSLRVVPGDRFEVSGSLRAEDEQPIPRPDLDWHLVDEGEGWLVVDKPVGCGVHPLRPDEDDTVLNAVVARRPDILGVGEGGLRSGVVHRLDVDTTGALLFATDAPTWKRLRGAFSEHRAVKRYVALLTGRFEKARRVDLPLSVTRHHPAHVSVVTEGGHPTREYVRPIEIFADATYVEVRLETGFLHQIRATMAHLGHPIVGDLEYGDTERARPVEVARPMLHAAHLTVDEIAVEIPLPEDFAAALAVLRSGVTPA
jgi:23S rRNA pseudouridine1911/1915/1917 synthase